MRIRSALTVFGFISAITLFGLSMLTALAVIAPTATLAATPPAHEGHQAPAKSTVHRAAPGSVVVQVDDAWVSQPAPGDHTTSAYFTVSNMGHGPVVLMGVSCPLAKRTVLRKALNGESGSESPRVKQVTVPPSQMLALQPGAMYVRLDGLRQRLFNGERVPLVLHFAGGTEIRVSAQVRPSIAE